MEAKTVLSQEDKSALERIIKATPDRDRAKLQQQIREQLAKMLEVLVERGADDVQSSP